MMKDNNVQKFRQRVTALFALARHHLNLIWFWEFWVLLVLLVTILGLIAQTSHSYRSATEMKIKIDPYGVKADFKNQERQGRLETGY